MNGIGAGHPDTVNEAVDKLRTLPDDKVMEVVQKLVKSVTDRFKQELVGQEENMERVIRNQSGKISRIAWKESQHWCKWSNNGPVLMPDYTRIYYRKGDTEVVLQEFPPQTRLLKFQGYLVDRKNTSVQMSERDGTQIRSFSLGLPYTVFIFRFHKGVFDSVFCAFSDRPLKTLEEVPLKPYFSNINDNLRVCLGTFNKDRLETGDIAQQCAYVLDFFWQSSFCDEWGSHFWSSRKHFIDNNEDRLVTIPAWQDATEEDPLFVVDDVDWPKVSDANFGDMIHRCFEEADSKNSEFQQSLFQELVDGLLEEVKKSLTESVSIVEENVLKLDIAKELERQIQGS